MRNAAFWHAPIRFAYKKVGGLHFIALGHITISWSVTPRTVDMVDNTQHGYNARDYE